MVSGRLTHRLIDIADLFVGRMRGGAAQTTVGASMIFSGLTGSATADASAIGSIMIPTMRDRGYKTEFAAAVVAASAVVGPIIPPSLTMIIYSVTTGVSIGGLFVAGIIPGIIMTIFISIATYMISRKNNYPRSEADFTLSYIIRTLRVGFFASLLPVIIVGGILAGYFTATEAAAVSVAFAIIFSVIQRTFDVRQLPQILFNATLISSVVIMILATSNVLSWILSVSNLPNDIADVLKSLSDNKYVFLLLVNIFLLIVGTFLDTFPAIFLLAPILHPIALSYGVDPLQFGVIVSVNILIGLITPPVGTNLFIVSSIAKTTVEKITKAILPFIVVEIIALFLITYIPALSLYLPKLAGY